MSSQREIVQEIEFASTLSDWVQVYEQVYVLRMRKIRDTVTKTRNFVTGLIDVYNELRLAYELKLEKLKLNKKELNVLDKYKSLQKPRYLLAVMLSTSERWAGEINQKVFSLFEKFISRNKEAEIVIVGNEGKKIFDRRIEGRSYRYFDLSEGKVNLNDLKDISEWLLRYEQVKVFGGKFFSFVNQKGEIYSIPGDERKTKEKGTDFGQGDYLFEPSLEEVLEYFEKQIYMSLFKQTVDESNLAQLGSRIPALEDASTNIGKRLKLLRLEEMTLTKRRINKKQLSSLVYNLI